LRIAVRYQSRGGNTRKVAEAIARKSGVVAKPLDPTEKFSPAVDLLFVGGGVYANKPQKSVTGALSELAADQVSGVAFFFTSVLPAGQVEGKLRAAVKDPAIALSAEVFQSPGKFLFFQKDHPDSADLAKAEVFAKRTIDARRKALEEIKWRG
jgi:flavodoxin